MLVCNNQKTLVELIAVFLFKTCQKRRINPAVPWESIGYHHGKLVANLNHIFPHPMSTIVLFKIHHLFF
jgi:hypothetical protein